MRFFYVYSVFKSVTGPGYLHLGLFITQMIFLRKPSPETSYNYANGPELVENAWQMVNLIRYSHLAIGLATVLKEQYEIYQTKSIILSEKISN